MIGAFLGRQGQGKTISMLFMAKLLHEWFPDYPIYSNISGIKDVYTPLVTSFEQMTKISSSIIMLDEAHHELDSRAFAKNVERTRWISQMRKRKNILLYNSQQFHKIDVRLRDETHFVVMCHNIGDGQFKLILIDGVDYDKEDFRFIVTKYVDLSMFYDMYDTCQIMEPLRP